MLKLVLPKGSLEAPTFTLFDEADLTVKRSSSVDYRGSVDDPRIDDVRILRPQEIPIYIEQGLFDIGITGLDWIEETESDVELIGDLEYSKNTSDPVRIVVAVSGDSKAQTVGDLPQGVRVSTEFPSLARRFFAKHGIEARVSQSYGATEAKVPDIADVVVELTETGRALRAAGLRILDTVLVSNTRIVANKEAAADPTKRHAMDQLLTLLHGALEARRSVLVKLNVNESDAKAVIDILPSMKSPTVSKLWDQESLAVETVVPRKDINELLPALKDAGAYDIIELPLRKILE